MKKVLVLFISTIVLLCLSDYVYAQNNYLSPCGTVIAGDDCQNAEVTSICELDGFSTSSKDLTPDLGCILDGVFCGPGSAADNNMWIGFQIAPGERAVKFAIDIQGCSFSDGVQAAIFKLNDCSCSGSLVPVSCVNCVANNFELAAFNLEENTNYYIMIDGCNGDECDFVINVIDGLPDVSVDISSISSFPLCEETKDCSTTTTLSATASPGNPNSYIYDWYNTATGVHVGSGRFLEASACVGDEYRVKARRPDDCCPAEAETTIILAPLAERSIAVLNNTPQEITIGCNYPFSELVLDATGSSTSNNHSYAWISPDGNSIADNELTISIPIDEVVAGTYTFAVYHTLTFCTDEVEVSVVINTDSPTAIIEVDEELLICATTEPIELDASNSIAQNDLSYEWSNDLGTAPTANVTANGTYTVTVTNTVNACSSTQTINIDRPDPLEVLLEAQAPTNGNNGSAQAFPSGGVLPYTYLWSNGATTASITDLSDGTYQLTLTDANNCEFIGSVDVGMPSSLETPDFVQQFNVYPNPNNGQFQVLLELDEARAGNLSLYNMLGEQVFYKKYDQKTIETSINLRDISSGTYILAWRSSAHIVLEKVVLY